MPFPCTSLRDRGSKERGLGAAGFFFTEFLLSPTLGWTAFRLKGRRGLLLERTLSLAGLRSEFTS